MFFCGMRKDLCYLNSGFSVDFTGVYSCDIPVERKQNRAGKLSWDESDRLCFFSESTHEKDRYKIPERPQTNG